jgi:pimeloyl-ACP methyl ester carboxylesterase
MSRRLNHIVLIHGACHGAYCWELVAPLLLDMGYHLSAPDLPGLGHDRTPIESITLQSYIDRAVQAVKAAAEPVLLVGHSMGGTVSCGAAEAIPEQLGRVVFIAGGLPLDGEAVVDVQPHITESGEPSGLEQTHASSVENAIEFEIGPNGEPFYNTCSSEVVRRAAARLRPQPIAPWKTPLRLTPDRFGAVPKTYIVCKQDRALPASVQHFLCARTPGIRKREIDTDHSPFYSDPEGLAAMLDEEARI